MHFKTMTWNVNESSNSGGRVDAQLEYIGEVGADVVMLQAVRWETWLPTWLDGHGRKRASLESVERPRADGGGVRGDIAHVWHARSGLREVIRGR